jgi:GNAT superfamily N-acetyltransferase
VAPSWIKPLAAALAGAPAFEGCALRPATRADEPVLFELHREAMRDYVEATWGWEEGWQRNHFAETFMPSRHAIVVRGASAQLVGRICLTRHWRHDFLRDIELVVSERRRGLGAAIIAAVIDLARRRGKAVELVVLKCNPAQRLYARLGFVVTQDDGERLTMRV